MNELYKPHTLSGDNMPTERPVLSHEVELDPHRHPEQDEVSEILKNIDFKVLKEIFLEHFQKSGNVPETLNFFDRDEVSVIYDQLQAAGAATKSKLIINAARANKPLDILWLLIHEQLHQASNTPVYQEQNEGEYVTSTRSGYRTYQTETTSNGGDLFFDLFKEVNEGVTELLTEEIFDEYLHRTGLADNVTRYDVSVKKFLSFMDSETTTEGEAANYARYRKNVLFYIGILSALTGTPSNVVRGAVIRGYFRNGDFMFEELYEHLNGSDEVFGELLKLLQSDKPDNEMYYDFIETLYTHKIITSEDEVSVLRNTLRSITDKSQQNIDALDETEK